MKQKSPIFRVIVIAVIITAVACNNNSSRVSSTNTGNTFGDSIPVSNGLMGKIFLLPANTLSLPDFDTMKPLSNYIYTNAIDIPPQSWSAGFPGLRDRFEWFGIEYTCLFRTDSTGSYVFRLLSDDGARLFIDGKLIIDNNGLHGPLSKTGNVFLSDSMHKAKIQYFQGPRYQLALQLFWSLENSKEQIFPGKNFIVYTPKSSSHFMWLLLLAALILILITVFIWTKRRSGRNPGNKRSTNEV